MCKTEIIFSLRSFRKLFFKLLLTLPKVCCKILLEIVGITTRGNCPTQNQRLGKSR